MPVSHHSHSGQYCAHAHGKLADVVAKAAELGFTTFCLSEHMPRLKEEELYPEEIEVCSGCIFVYEIGSGSVWSDCVLLR